MPDLLRHYPNGSGHCATCGGRWVCGAAQADLRRDYRNDPQGLAFYLSVQSAAEAMAGPRAEIESLRAAVAAAAERAKQLPDTGALAHELLTIAETQFGPDLETPTDVANRVAAWAYPHPAVPQPRPTPDDDALWAKKNTIGPRQAKHAYRGVNGAGPGKVWGP